MGFGSGAWFQIRDGGSMAYSKGSFRSIADGTSLVVQWLGLCPLVQGVWVRSLVRELRSHTAQGQKKNPKHKQQKQYYNNSIKTLEIVHIQKKKKNKEWNIGETWTTSLMQTLVSCVISVSHCTSLCLGIPIWKTRVNIPTSRKGYELFVLLEMCSTE